MPGGAHHPAAARRIGDERGFSLIEIIIVMVLLIIAMLAAVSTLTSVKRNGADVRYTTAASTIWRGIGAYRQDNKGAMPPLTLLGSEGANFKNLAGTRYVAEWPEDPDGSGRIEVGEGTGAPADSGPASSLLYSTDGTEGWLAAYGHDGRLIFLRGVTRDTPVVPVG